MPSARVLLAGATGTVGGALLPLLREAGHRVRTLSRRAERAQGLAALADEVIVADATDRAALAGIASGIDVVVSCVGASIAPNATDRRSFGSVDTVANGHLLSQAVTAGVRRFVYVAAFVQPGYADCRYITAHEAFVARLRASGIASSVVRPTGLFNALRPLLPMAAKGRLVVIGDGLSRTNPVHPLDVARACLGVLDDGPPDVPIGGPDVLTRAEIARAAFAAVGVVPNLLHLAPWVSRSTAGAARLMHPRLGELLDFASRVSVVDAIAPKLGSEHLDEYFRREWASRTMEAGVARVADLRRA
ncbi:MAG TPA: NAD(P)H-binding protein [Polyangiaceae bacterium]|nr:NAD(P)H-binding protein [Polyangiaceae bacterium]